MFQMEGKAPRQSLVWPCVPSRGACHCLSDVGLAPVTGFASAQSRTWEAH